ncbi:cyclase family protein [Paraflavitalea pollutisoli]|uniref:cyclase family protein n=1 Tax=Paraflavitalea pollutisoli TaxID=3034143 RepID=UPI0023EAC3DB|nr:cyclase family protein [Paraflavitalea sp. H1-2-19X]
MTHKRLASTLIDLSHTIDPSISVYPGTPAPGIEQIASVKADGYAEWKLTLTTHMGTHIDAPAHMVVGGKTLDQYAPESFVGDALVIDCRAPGPHISLDWLKPWELQIDVVDFALLYTGWSAKWSTADYLTGYPVLTKDAAQWLANKSLKGIGMDTISPDPLEAHHYPIHHILFKQELLIIENLTNLEVLAGQVFQLVCLPLKVDRSDAAPARAIAILPR